MSLPPGPRTPALLQMVHWATRPEKVMRDCQRRYGNTFTLNLIPSGKVVLFSDPASIREVFTGSPDDAHAGKANEMLGMLVGDKSVLLLDGQEHMRHRRLLMPAFRGDRMRVYGQTMERITEAAIADWAHGDTLSLHPTMQRITLEVILETVFGLTRGARFEEFRDTLTQLMATGEHPLAFAAMAFPAMRRTLGPLTPYAKFARLRDAADALIYDEIDKRRQSKDEREDVLGLLLTARDEHGESMTDVELRDELMTTLAAGHETTASALCWAFERIASTPRVEARLRSELASALGGAGAGTGTEREATPSDLAALPYLDATIKEALRTRPIIPVVGRVTQRTLQVGGWTIPEGVMLAPCIYLMHRDGSIYPQPAAFRPERFLDKKPDPYAWLPFGGGSRRCLGMAFALYEMRIVLANVLLRTQLTLKEPSPLPAVRRSITLLPKAGAEMHVARLDSVSRPTTRRTERPVTDQPAPR
jgi:cytochrome P450